MHHLVKKHKGVVYCRVGQLHSSNDGVSREVKYVKSRRAGMSNWSIFSVSNITKRFIEAGHTVWGVTVKTVYAAVNLC